MVTLRAQRTDTATTPNGTTIRPPRARSAPGSEPTEPDSEHQGRTSASARTTDRASRPGRESERPLLIANSMSIASTACPIRRLVSFRHWGRRGRFEDSGTWAVAHARSPRWCSARGAPASIGRATGLSATATCVVSKREWDALATAPKSVTKSPEVCDYQSTP